MSIGWIQREIENRIMNETQTWFRNRGRNTFSIPAIGWIQRERERQIMNETQTWFRNRFK